MTKVSEYIENVCSQTTCLNIKIFSIFIIIIRNKINIVVTQLRVDCDYP
jgi:hypothetical protein